jgi:uncharacterized membrane protein
LAIMNQENVNTNRGGRILAIDAMRAIALFAMALDHAAASVWVSLQAESYGGMVAILPSWPYWVSGLFTNLAAPTFWLLSGVSIALYSASRRKQGYSEWQVTRHFLIRSVVIIVLDLTICNLAWAGNGPYLHVLTSIGIGLALVSLARLLPTYMIAIIFGSILILYQVFLSFWGVALSQTHNFLVALLLTYSTEIRPAVEFSTFGWATLMGLGYLLGQLVLAHKFRRPRAWFLSGAALLGVWLVLRLMGGFGDLTPYLTGQPWYFFVIMNKTPPSLTYFAFNLGIASLAMGVLIHFSSWLTRKPFSWLVTTGQVALFFFVVHILAYGVLGRLSRWVNPPVPGLIEALIVWSLGLLILIPLCIMYRKKRRQNPDSLLKYL